MALVHCLSALLSLVLVPAIPEPAAPEDIVECRSDSGLSMRQVEENRWFEAAYGGRTGSRTGLLLYRDMADDCCLCAKRVADDHLDMVVATFRLMRWKAVHRLLLGSLSQTAREARETASLSSEFAEVR